MAGGAFGGSIAFGVGQLNQARGLEGWRWLFIIEGAPSCACAICAWLFYPDFPETVSWLSGKERDLVTSRIRGVASLGHAKITWTETRETLLDWRLYLHFLVWAFVSRLYVLDTSDSGLAQSVYHFALWFRSFLGNAFVQQSTRHRMHSCTGRRAT